MPLVGITTNALVSLGRTEIPGGGSVMIERPRVHLSLDYGRGVVEAGGEAVLLQPGTAATIVDRLDGLVLSGGRDVASELYGAEAHPLSGPTSAVVDGAEIALVRRALAADLPVLGICRGMQLLNVALGGTLHGHLPDSFSGVDHAPEYYEERFTHEVVVAGDRLRSIVGERLLVNSSHHQGIDRLGDGCEATAHALDGVVEAIEVPVGRWCMGVQWHPEIIRSARAQQSLFDAFVEACRDS